MFPGVVPFPPANSQLYVPASHAEEEEEELIYTFEEEDAADLANVREEERKERNEVARKGPRANQRDTWMRLSEFGSAMAGTCVLFDQSRVSATNMGRVYRGMLDNTYLVEALNAISLRPALVRSLFYNYDVQRSIYIVRIFKNGIWMKVEVDDYVPAGNVSNELADQNAPFCCRSEQFPFVLWPSIVEKAYAKVCTLRDPRNPANDSGGWNAVGGGGHVEEALADLTGGVAGRFYTHDVSSDRLFVYLHSLQRDSLFVCRVNADQCARKGIHLNPFACHAINRAASYDGRGYVQVFCADATGVHDGGLSDLTVPTALVNEYPERSWEGFFWLCIEDFHAYFDTIFECRLTSSPDVGIIGMPPPRLPNASFQGPGAPPPLYFETIFANPGRVSERRPPEIGIATPNTPCEVIVTVQQTDSRITQVGDDRSSYVPILLKVYEDLGYGGEVFSDELVCKSNWIATRDSMVAFKTTRGGAFKVMVEMPRDASCDRLIIRCYSSLMNTDFHVTGAMRAHQLAARQGPANATRATFVGTVDRSRITRPTMPEPLVEDLDALRRRQKESSCSIM
eukprot:TRINITY_DN15091_c0_g1_i1.p1 TRINITY_DN15091_c0_g1~~TRINITY_DN15091_c0_g1_i1.p1  ORF type:complete len:568 (-),score=88.89 TRINITY_DN15091_c0_g1_i1:11-1714(-)